jgi:hypothetical protein
MIRAVAAKGAAEAAGANRPSGEFYPRMIPRETL